MSDPLAPLLLLYSDLWTPITALLDIVDVRRLLCTGNSLLISRLRRSTKSLSCTWKSTSAIDLDRLLELSNQLECLESFSFDCILQTIWMKKSPQVLVLPCSLTSLRLKLSHSMDRISECQLSSQTPNLRILELSGSTSQDFRLTQLNLPPRLEELGLRMSSHVFRILEGDLASLPKTLVKLLLSNVYELEVKHSSEWPPSLHSLQMNARGCQIEIDTLPRTLNSLYLEDTASLRTKFSSVDVEFPWRLYFPRLVSLVISPSESLAPNFFHSMLMDNAVPHEKFVENWFTSPALPDLALAPSPNVEYPKLQVYWGPIPFQSDFSSESLKQLAPLLTSLDMWAVDSEMPLSFWEFFPSLKALSSNTTDFPKGFKPPQSLSELECNSVYIQDLPPKLHTLRCCSLIGVEQEDGSTTFDGCKLPQGLEYFFLVDNILPLQLARILPSGLRTCCIDLGTDSESHSPLEIWNELTGRLTSLGHLVLEVREWNETEVGFIGSTRSTSMSLQFHDGFTFPSTHPRLGQFFNSFAAGMLQSLDLYSGAVKWPFALVPALPKSLTELRMWGITWESTTHEEFPLGHSMSPEELIDSLPPKLTLLFLLGEQGGTTKSLELLSHLPKNLGFLLTSHLFSAPEFEGGAGESEWTLNLAKRLPPNLSSLFLSCYTDLVELYFTQVRTDIYSDYTQKNHA